MSRNFVWTDEAVETLKILWAQGNVTTAQISAVLGVSKNAVCGKVHRLKLKSHSRFNQVIPGVARSRVARDVNKTQAARPPMTSPSPKVVTMSEVGTDHVNLNIPLVDLEAFQCHWVTIESSRTTPAFYCGNPVKQNGKDYCAHHHARVYCSPEEARDARRAHHSVTLANYRKAKAKTAA
jgi:hypothetical protein